MAKETKAAAPGTKQSDDKGIAEWKQFEQRVAHFLAAHCPSGRVTHDYKQVDTDTGSLRQRRCLD